MFLCKPHLKNRGQFRIAELESRRLTPIPIKALVSSANHGRHTFLSFASFQARERPLSCLLSKLLPTSFSQDESGQ